jgi:hypothetical protein
MQTARWSAARAQLLLGRGGKITKVHLLCAPTEEEGWANHCLGPGVDVPAEGNADGNMIGGKGAIAAWLRRTM